MSARAPAGPLDRTLTLEARSPQPDGGGGSTPGWSAVAVLRGAIESGGRGAGGAPGLPATRIEHRVFVRWLRHDHPARPRAGQRFRCEGRTLDVFSVEEVDPRRRHLLCRAAEDQPR